MHYYLYIRSLDKNTKILLTDSSDYVKLLIMRDRLNGYHPKQRMDVLAQNFHAQVLTEYCSDFGWQNVEDSERPSYVHENEEILEY